VDEAPPSWSAGVVPRVSCRGGFASRLADAAVSGALGRGSAGRIVSTISSSLCAPAASSRCPLESRPVDGVDEVVRPHGVRHGVNRRLTGQVRGSDGVRMSSAGLAGIVNASGRRSLSGCGIVICTGVVFEMAVSPVRYIRRPEWVSEPRATRSKNGMINTDPRRDKPLSSAR